MMLLRCLAISTAPLLMLATCTDSEEKPHAPNGGESVGGESGRDGEGGVGGTAGTNRGGSSIGAGEGGASAGVGGNAGEAGTANLGCIGLWRGF